MSETKDPAIKLFGKTIPVPDILVGTPALSSGDVVDESIDQNHDSSINSSKDEQEQEIVMVREFFWVEKIFDFDFDPLFGMKKYLMGWC